MNELVAIFRTIMNKREKMVGIFSWYGFNIPFLDRINSIKNAGFDATSIWLGLDEDLIRNGRMDDMPYLVRDSGLYLENVHIPSTNCNHIWSNDSNLIKAISEEYKKYIDFCSNNNIPIMVMHISKGNEIKEINKNGIDFIKQLVKIGEYFNVKIAIENTRIPVFLDKIYEQIDSKYLGFCYDSSHDVLYSKNPYELLTKYENRLFCIHLSDNNGKEDSHWLPYEGIIDWSSLIDHFPKEYTGVYTLEAFPKNDEKNIDFLNNALIIIERIEKEIKNCPKNCN